MYYKLHIQIPLTGYVGSHIRLNSCSCSELVYLLRFSAATMTGATVHAAVAAEYVYTEVLQLAVATVVLHRTYIRLTRADWRNLDVYVFIRIA